MICDSICKGFSCNHINIHSTYIRVSMRATPASNDTHETLKESFQLGSAALMIICHTVR